MRMSVLKTRLALLITVLLTFSGAPRAFAALEDLADEQTEGLSVNADKCLNGQCHKMVKNSNFTQNENRDLQVLADIVPSSEKKPGDKSSGTNK